VRVARHIEEDLMNRLRFAVAVGATLFVAAPSMQAQIRRNNTVVGVVPTGMCRIWIDGVPDDRQPAATDCATARARVPRNGRVIYGSQTQGPANGDPRLDPRSGQNDPRYDPRYDPRSPQYDPRLDPRNDGRRDDKYDRKREREREKWQRKQEKERNKQYDRNGRRSGNDDHHDDGDDDGDHNGQHGQRGQNEEHGQNGNQGDRRNGQYDPRVGIPTQGCVDANRDGICDTVQGRSRARFP
jgi:hypothetical protein